MTSSYLEGQDNQLGAYGCNRDGKKGKKHIVIGLLCDEHGEPLSTEVFRGSTQDPATFASQVNKAKDRFGCERVTFVGDRGMIKSGQIQDLKKAGFHHITAITKPQISGAAQPVRYILQRKPSLLSAQAAGLDPNDFGFSEGRFLLDDSRYVLQTKPGPDSFC